MLHSRPQFYMVTVSLINIHKPTSHSSEKHKRDTRFGNATNCFPSCTNFSATPKSIKTSNNGKKNHPSFTQRKKFA